MTDERLRPYARHLDGCRFVLDLMDAPDPTLAAEGQCDCGFDAALAATPETPTHVHDYGATRIPCSQDHSGVGDSTLPEHPFYQDPLPREAGRCDAVYPDGEWCGLSEQEHRAALAATPEREPMNEDTTRIDYGDSFETDFGNVGDPRWPERLTMRLFRRDERGQRLVVDEQEYVRVARLSSEPRQ